MLRRITLALLLLALPFSATADITIGSWNLKHAGWRNDKRLDLVAEVMARSDVDLWALQEVMKSEAVDTLEAELERQTGEEWSSMTSHTVGRSSYREAYAFLWRDSAVDYTKGAVVYLDPGDLFAREPFLAEFRDKSNGDAFTMATVHIVYGDHRSDRTPEIRELASIWDWMAEVYPGSARVIAGDYNLPPSDNAWQPLRDAGAKRYVTGATTLSTTDGHYTSAYDGFWSDAGVTMAGIARFPQVLGIDHQTARDIISDHAPIYLTTGDTHAGFSDAQAVNDATTQDTSSAACVDLNKASLGQLDSLPNVGPARAQDIINGRPWVNAHDLTDINGIGPARLEDLRESGLMCNL